MRMSEVEQNGITRSADNSRPVGIAGWLLYICIVLSILSPFRMLQYLQQTSVPLMVVTYATIGISSLSAGVATWARSSLAFLCLRVAFLVRILYAFLQIYLGLRLTQHSGGDARLAQQELVSAATNIVLVVALFLYFRLSRRVRNTLGRNM